MKEIKFAPSLTGPGKYAYTEHSKGMLRQCTWGVLPPVYRLGRLLAVRAYSYEIARAIYLHYTLEESSTE